MWFYIAWVSGAMVFYSIYAYLSYKNNLVGGGWMWSMWAMGVIAPWPLISRFSKNLFFDGMLYDAVIFLTYTIIIGVLTHGFIKFTTGQWIGFGLMVSGFFLMKYYSA